MGKRLRDIKGDVYGATWQGQKRYKYYRRYQRGCNYHPVSTTRLRSAHPLWGNHRYDLVIEDAERRFWRIQCKTARIDNDAVIKFDTANHNVTGEKRESRHYRGECDYFAVYSPELNKVYLVPIDEVSTTRANLRLTPPKNKNQHGYRMAKDYEL